MLDISNISESTYDTVNSNPTLDFNGSDSSNQDLNISTQSHDSEHEFKLLSDKVHRILKKSAVNNVLIVPGKKSKRNVEMQMLFTEYVDCLTLEYWVPDNKPSIWGPPCYLCNEDIFYEGTSTVLSNERYEIFFENDTFYENDKCTSSNDESYQGQGLLQCVYCFNYFHRWNCSLTMNKKSYLQAIRNKTWACPTCVPAFVPRSKRNKALIFKSERNDMPVDNFLVKLFLWLLKQSNFCLLDYFYHCDDVYVVFNKFFELEYFDYG
jgi:hypothetical protein